MSSFKNSSVIVFFTLIVSIHFSKEILLFHMFKKSHYTCVKELKEIAFVHKDTLLCYLCYSQYFTALFVDKVKN